MIVIGNDVYYYHNPDDDYDYHDSDVIDDDCDDFHESENVD